jgi:gamma-glutamylcyclotransferase (GGCT)/AIG2-like uncharacterized protein YtfP
MSDYLFTYGTLQPGIAPAEMAHVAAKLKVIGDGTVRGRLYDLGSYPGAILDPSTDQKVTGLVLELTNGEDLLPELDAYEEYNPEATASSLFLRVLHPVELAKGDTLQCWIYVWNGFSASAPIIPNGRFQKRSY